MMSDWTSVILIRIGNFTLIPCLLEQFSPSKISHLSWKRLLEIIYRICLYGQRLNMHLIEGHLH